MEKSNQYYEIDLLQLFGTLWRKAWAIILSSLIGGAAAFLCAAFLMTPMYKAEAKMYVSNTSRSVDNTRSSISNAELAAAQSLVDTYIIILNSRGTLDEVIQKTGLTYTYEELKNMLSVEPMNGTEIFSITVTSKDPQEAKLIANTIVDILPGRIANVVEGSSVRVVDHAMLPTKKASPNITMFTAIGILLGFAVSCMVVIIRQVSDTLIHNEDYLMETYELPVLAVVPDLFSSSSQNAYYSEYETKMRSEANR